MASKTERFWYIDRQEVDVSIDPDASTSVIGLVEKGTSTVTRNGYSSGYKDPRNSDLNNAQYFDQEYNTGVKEAKKFARSNYQTVGSIRQQDF